MLSLMSRETAPAAANRDMFVDGKASSQIGRHTYMFLNLYIHLRRSRDVFVPSFVRLLLSLQFALASFYAHCPHKRIA